MVFIATAINCYTKSEIVPLALELESLKYDIEYNPSGMYFAKDYMDMIAVHATHVISTTQGQDEIKTDDSPNVTVPRYVNVNRLIDTFFAYLFAIVPINEPDNDTFKTFPEFCNSHEDDLFRFLAMTEMQNKNTKEEIMNQIRYLYEQDTQGSPSFEHMLYVGSVVQEYSNKITLCKDSSTCFKA